MQHKIITFAMQLALPERSQVVTVLSPCSDSFFFFFPFFFPFFFIFFPFFLSFFDCTAESQSGDSTSLPRESGEGEKADNAPVSSEGGVNAESSPGGTAEVEADTTDDQKTLPSAKKPRVEVAASGKNVDVPEEIGRDQGIAVAEQ